MMRARVWKDTDGLWLWQVSVPPEPGHKMAFTMSGSRHSWAEAFNQVCREMQYMSGW